MTQSQLDSLHNLASDIQQVAAKAVRIRLRIMRAKNCGGLERGAMADVAEHLTIGHDVLEALIRDSQPRGG